MKFNKVFICFIVLSIPFLPATGFVTKHHSANTGLMVTDTMVPRFG